MTIKDYIKQITSSIEDAKLNELNKKVHEVSNMMYGAFATFKTLVDLERVKYQKDTEIKVNDLLIEINRDYRKYILNVSPNYKRENMTVWSFSGKTLTDEIGKEFNFNFNKKNYKDRVRIAYTKDKLYRAMVIALSFLIAKYPVVYDFQIITTFIKVLIDFFDFKSINYYEAFSIYSQIINLEISTLTNKIKEIGLQPKVKIKRERKSKTELPSKEQFEYWLNSGQYSRTQLEEIIAKQFHVSTRTVHRQLVEYGLTRKYKDNKKEN